jgi:hypothetical protein
VPPVPVGEGWDKCCHGILTAQAAEMAWWQRITYGTTAWRISMGRRQVVQSVNAALKGVFADLGRGFMRVMGVTNNDRHAGFHHGRLRSRNSITYTYICSIQTTHRLVRSMAHSRRWRTVAGFAGSPIVRFSARRIGR